MAKAVFRFGFGEIGVLGTRAACTSSVLSSPRSAPSARPGAGGRSRVSSPGRERPQPAPAADAWRGRCASRLLPVRTLSMAVAYALAIAAASPAVRACAMIWSRSVCAPVAGRKRVSSDAAVGDARVRFAALHLLGGGLGQFRGVDQLRLRADRGEARARDARHLERRGLVLIRAHAS